MGRRNRNKKQQDMKRKDRGDDRDKDTKRQRLDDAKADSIQTQEPWGYKMTDKNNKMFETFYKMQNIIPEDEWETFMATMREPLPITFRATGFKSEVQELLKIIKSDFFSNMVDIEIEGKKVDPPSTLPWYPDGCGWQINLTKQMVRKSPPLEKLHKFLISETESGNISRQEAVSMIPPLLMDIKPHHKVLDMCAAPGSKTAQLIEYLHADESIKLPEGFVIANDADNKRCYMMTHQVKRLASPNFMIINHDASTMPNIFLSDPGAGEKKCLMYDRVLADVPCSGDGTMRKNPDVWGKWTVANGHNLHGLQTRILKRGLALLGDNGRLVYSTCSLNPIEDEAVVASTLLQWRNMSANKNCEIRLVDISKELPGLKHNKGVSHWKIMSKTSDVYENMSEVPEALHTQIRPSMFPPTPEQAESLNLDRCIRILPHLQNTGGFFVAVIEKVPRIQQEDQQKADVTLTAPIDDTTKEPEAANGEEGKKEVEYVKKQDRDWSKPEIAPYCSQMKKKRKAGGFKEDPYIFLEETDPIWPPIQKFFNMDKEFDHKYLLVRCGEGKKRNIYYTSPHIKTILAHNEERVKFINLGVKVLVRSDHDDCDCSFRLCQEGLHMMFPFLNARSLKVHSRDIVTMLSTENPFLDNFSNDVHSQAKAYSVGSIWFIYDPSDEAFMDQDDRENGPNCKLVFCGWKGKVSMRSFVPKQERFHFLRLCGVQPQDALFKRGHMKSPPANTQEAIQRIPGTDSMDVTSSADNQTAESDVPAEDDDVQTTASDIPAKYSATDDTESAMDSATENTDTVNDVTQSNNSTEATEAT
ncbi:unnamed protein product [Owenia fusiformis]|uniref:tRNA (cytosine(34)-C(5))-methyltransferase n=1 Tax=Owenia fusiformis TaxID=6347 RepID=A0A8S4QEP7_OWEFU|nr:unnamed protein product [Owenia fusiformis]